jgi:lipid-binding SYLF domain-containing protein
MNNILTSILIISTILISGCVSTDKSTTSEKRQAVLTMKSKVLSDLYKLKPDVRSQIASAPGYAVFSNVNINLLFASFGGGQGIVKNNNSGKNTFMKMGEVGVGLGLGAKDFRIIFVFHNKAVMKRFIEQGWAVGAQTDAAAKANDKGAAVGGEITLDDMTVYQLTESGLALQATVKGTKYWKDEELN